MLFLSFDLFLFIPAFAGILQIAFIFIRGSFFKINSQKYLMNQKFETKL